MPTVAFKTIQAFTDQVHAITKLDDLTATLAAAVEGVGITSISTNMISQPGRDRRPGILFGHGDWRDWSRHYARASYQHYDPALRMLGEVNLPFTWTEALQRFGSKPAERVIDACRDFSGLADALVVPVRDTDQAVLTVTFAGQELALDAPSRTALHLASYYYAARGREILAGFELQARTPLTLQQLACLEWVYRGKTDADIAQILGLSPRTVHNHIEAAKDRLGCAKRALAAKEAWRRGWII